MISALVYHNHYYHLYLSFLVFGSFDSIHTHGTGCTLSSVIASALALGHQQRSITEGAEGEGGTGATRAIHMIDACCIAKAYITEGVARGIQVRERISRCSFSRMRCSHRRN